MKIAIYLTLLSVLIVAGITTFASCGASSEPTTPAKGDTQVKPPEGQTPGPDYTPGVTVEVTIKDYVYIPETITITTGTTVTWTNNDTVRHTATDRNGMFNSDLLAKGENYSYTFHEKGEYEYYCIPHPYMMGHVIVE